MKHTRASKWLPLVAVVGFITVLAGSAAGASERAKSPRAAKKTTVTLSGWSLAGAKTEQNGVLKTVAAFERTHKNIDVNYAPISGDYDAAMLARFASRRPPDVFYVDSLDVPDYGPALLPLNDLIKKNHFNVNALYPRLVAEFKYKGKIVGFPKDWSPIGLVANTRMLAKAKVKAPTTWAQFTSVLKKLKSSNAVPGGAPACLDLDWARILTFVYQNKGAWLNPARTKSLINSPANRQTLTTYFGWLKSGLAKTHQQLGVDWCGEALGKEKAAIVFEGNWIYAFEQTTYPNLKFKVYPMLKGKQKGNLSFSAAYAIGRDSKNKAAAWQLLSWLAGRQGQTTWTHSVGFLSARKDVKVPAGRAAYVKEAPYARPWSFIRGFDKLNDFAGKELEKAFNGNESVAEMLKNIDAKTKDTLAGK